MPAADDNPHRRNLSVTSFLFITYFWAGGHLTDSSLKLPMVNIAIDNPFIVGVLAWGILFFFAWRYKLKTKYVFDNFSSDCITEMRINHWLRLYTFNKLPEGHNLNSDLKANGATQEVIEWGGLTGKIKLRAHKINQYNDSHRTISANSVSFNFTMGEPPSCLDYELSYLRSLTLRCQIGMAAAAKREQFSDFVLPYMLFLIAVLSGVIVLLSSIDIHNLAASACETLRDCHRIVNH